MSKIKKISYRKFCLSITFDQFYIEPALLTAYEILNCGLSYKLHLVYIEPKDKDTSNEMENILLKFKGTINNDQLIIIKVANTLNDYNKFHFTNSIIYKILNPSIIKDYDFILNLDAGILCGNKFVDFIECIITEVNNHKHDNSLVSAFCTDSEVDLNIGLHNFPHNSKYPSGIVMLFNVRNYDLFNTVDKILSTWYQFSDYFIYGEQDLLCIIAEEGQISQLPMSDSIIIEYLDLKGKKKRQNFDGLHATCIQHEIDHLNGITITDHIDIPSEKIAAKQLAIQIKKTIQ